MTTARKAGSARSWARFGAYLGCAALLVARTARGEELAGELIVTREAGAESCPDQPELVRKVLSLGGRQPGAQPDPVRVEVTFWRDASGYVATVRASGGKEGVRELGKAGESCNELGDETSVVVAVLFDLLPPTSPQPPAVTPVPTREQPPSNTAPRPEPPRSPNPTPTQPFSVALGAHAGIGYGVVGPVASAALGGAIRPRLGGWEASIGVLGVPVREVPYETQVIEASLLTSRLGVCYWLTGLQDQFGWAGCLGAQLGALSGQGRGFDTDRSAGDLWFAGEAALAGRFRLNRHWAIRAGLSLLVPRPYTFSVAGEGAAVESLPVAGLLELGFELQIQ